MTSTAQATTAQALKRTVRVGSLGGATIILFCIVTNLWQELTELSPAPED